MPWIKKIHKWASVIVGIQFLLWLLSGIYFNLMDSAKSYGHTYKNHGRPNAEVDNARLVEPHEVLRRFKASVSLQTTYLLGAPYYLLNHKKGLYANFENEYTLVDAYTAEALNIDKVFAAKLAKLSYNGPGDMSSVKLLPPPLDDYSNQYNASWQINFSDDINTSVYVEAGSGRIVGHSDDHKRLADIFHMLHFMDYANESSFNNIQIILFAIVTLWLSLTGLIWTVELGFRGQYRIKFFAKHQSVKLFDKHQKSMGTVTLSSHTNLLDGLIAHDISLPSNCGGGGTCGRCKVMISPRCKMTSADHFYFTDKELQQGYRLACQHFSNDVEQLSFIDVTNGQKHTLELSESRFVSPYIKELRFKVTGGSPLLFRAGAYMRFFIPAAKGISMPLNLPEKLKPHWHHIEHLEYEHLACTRNYSLAESSMNTDELVFTIKIQSAPNNGVLPGVGSSYLCNLPIGKSIEAIGPFEEFYAVKDSQKTMVLIGAGSGMAPLKSIIDEQLAIDSKVNNINEAPKVNEDENIDGRCIHFFYGARKESDLLYADKFYQMAEEFEHFQYYPTLSQANDRWSGATEYAQHLMATHLYSIDKLDNIEFYLCGPKDLMTQTIDLLKAKGVKDSAISFESFN